MELLAEQFQNISEEFLTERVIDATDARTDPRTSEFTDAYLTPLGSAPCSIFRFVSKGNWSGALQ